MAIRKQFRVTILARAKQREEDRRALKAPRKKRTRPEPRLYTIADLERARDRVEAAERRVESASTDKSNQARADLERARLKLQAIESSVPRTRTLQRAAPGSSAKNRPRMR
jgi:hypothetical protein